MPAVLPAAFLGHPIAHRALHDAALGRPENSRAALRAAVAAGYGIEIDVQLTADDKAVVFHDSWLSRLTAENGPVRLRSAAELARIPLRGSTECIPDLAEVCAIVGGAVPLLVEIKDQDGALGPDVGALEQAVAEALRGYDGPVAVMSFNPHSVAAMAELAPDLPRGLTTCAFDAQDWSLIPASRRDTLRMIPDYDRVGACFISHQWDDLDRPRVAELKAAGAAVLCWTITDPKAEAQARAVAQNITFEGYLPVRHDQ